MAKKEKTLQEICDSLTPEQKKTVIWMIGDAVERALGNEGLPELENPAALTYDQTRMVMFLINEAVENELRNTASRINRDMIRRFNHE